jgi:nucleoside-diphosphate-sugar epimerase
MKPRILLTGKTGQVGNALLHRLPGVGEVMAFDRQQLDLTKPEEIDFGGGVDAAVNRVMAVRLFKVD